MGKDKTAIRWIDGLIKTAEKLKEKYREVLVDNLRRDNMDGFDKGATESVVVGLALLDATNILEGLGVPFRVVREDKENYIITMDLRLNRANLEVDNRVVTGIYWG